MGAEENELTLEGLAQRLEKQAERLQTLERENERLHSENIQLGHKVAALERSGTRGDEVNEPRGSGVRRHKEPENIFDARVSRRQLLSKAGAAAVAAVAAGTLLNVRPAKAHELGASISASSVTTHLLNADNDISTFPAVWARAYSHEYSAVWAENFGTGPGLRGINFSASTGNGVEGIGRGNTGVGVLGVNDRGVGYDAFGVKGESSDAIGVKGIGRNGVVGESTFGEHAAVYGRHTGSSGYGVIGDGTGTGGAGVVGRNSSGYGGQFEGGKAQLKLKPGGRAGRPSGAHVTGEIYMDSAGALFVCVKGGTPGTWRKVTTRAV